MEQNDEILEFERKVNGVLKPFGGNFQANHVSVQGCEEMGLSGGVFDVAAPGVLYLEGSFTFPTADWNDNYKNGWRFRYTDETPWWKNPENKPNYRNIYSSWSDNDNNKENDMESLVEKRQYSTLDKDKRNAVKQGAMTEDGHLTSQGRDLLLELLLESDSQLREKFYQALNEIADLEEDED